MVDAELGRDLLSFGKPVLVLGDPAQLPPVRGGGFFTEADPDVMLTEVHRQAADNPIIQMSMLVREGGRPSSRSLWRKPGDRASRHRFSGGDGERSGAGRVEPHASIVQQKNARTVRP